MDVPEPVRQRALSSGDVGRRWLSELPDLVRALADRWELTLGAPYTGGTAAYVTAALTGEPALAARR